LPARQNMPLVCSVFLDLPNPFQAYVFATVNFNQKKVDRSLAYELFGFDTEDEPPQAWTPEKTAVFLTRRLNMDADSPLRGRIVVAAAGEQGSGSYLRRSSEISQFAERIGFRVWWNDRLVSVLGSAV